MVRPSTIVVGTDGSRGAEAAVEAAAEIAEAFDGEVHVIMARRTVQPGDVALVRAELPEEFRLAYDPTEADRTRLDDAAHRVVKHGVAVHSHVSNGDPAAAILDLADDVDADLIVVGSRGQGATMRFLRGSVSTKVMHHADRNVLIVHD